MTGLPSVAPHSLGLVGDHTYSTRLQSPADDTEQTANLIDPQSARQSLKRLCPDRLLKIGAINSRIQLSKNTILLLMLGPVFTQCLAEKLADRLVIRDRKAQAASAVRMPNRMTEVAGHSAG